MWLKLLRPKTASHHVLRRHSLRIRARVALRVVCVHNEFAKINLRPKNIEKRGKIFSLGPSYMSLTNTFCDKT